MRRARTSRTCTTSVCPSLARKRSSAAARSQHAADAGVDALEQLAALELALADGDDEELGVDVDRVGGGGGEVEHGVGADAPGGQRPA